MSGMLLAGSQKGSMLLAEIRKRYPNYHPILAIVDIAHHEQASLDLQFACHKTVAKYVEPELKSIEVKGDFKTQQSVRVSLFGDEEAETVPYAEVNQPDSVESSMVDAAVTAYTLGESGFD